MALKPIDDAIPVTVDNDRLIKQAKVAVPLDNTINQIKQSIDSVLTDENGNRLPPSTDASIDYVSSGDLKPIPDPDAKIQSLLDGLESKNWTELCDSLNDVRRFALYHSALLLPNVGMVIFVLVKAIKNPRSALCKTSIMASSDLFNAYGDQLLEPTASDAFDQLGQGRLGTYEGLLYLGEYQQNDPELLVLKLLQLLLKASQDKRFVCEEAEKALNVMVQSLSPLPLLRKLQAYVSHSNLRVRAKAALSISNCVSKMKPEEFNEFGTVSLVQIAAELLNDKLPEAREAARSIVVAVYESFVGDPEDQKQESWQNFCQSNLPALHAQSIVKITIPRSSSHLGNSWYQLETACTPSKDK